MIRMSYGWLACAYLMCANLPVVAADTRTVVVKPSSMSGWKVALQKGTLYESGEGTAVGEFTKGKYPSLLGKGSFHLNVGSSYKGPLSKVYLGTTEYNGISPAKITQFRLSICPVWHEAKGAQPVTVEIAVGDAAHLRLYTYLPWGFDPAGYYRYGQWREINLMKREGAWELTNIESTDNHGDWAWLVKRDPSFKIKTPPAVDWPNGAISGASLNIKIGAGAAFDRSHSLRPWWTESSCCRCYVDKLIVGYLDDSGKEIVTTYDFEPDSGDPSGASATAR